MRLGKSVSFSATVHSPSWQEGDSSLPVIATNFLQAGRSLPSVQFGNFADMRFHGVFAIHTWHYVQHFAQIGGVFLVDNYLTSRRHFRSSQAGRNVGEWRQHDSIRAVFRPRHKGRERRTPTTATNAVGRGGQVGS